MVERDNIIVVGAGGHAKVILATLTALSQNVIGLVDNNPKLIGTEVLNHPVIGDISFLNKYPRYSAICAIGDNQRRQMITSSFPEINWVTAIHPKATVHESVSIGKGTVVFAGAIIQPDTILGDHVIINTAATIDHDCHIEDFTHIAPGSHLGGGVHVGKGTLVGLGSSVRPSSAIGKWAVIGSGSVVVNNINSYAYAKGVPARVYKERDVSPHLLRG